MNTISSIQVVNVRWLNATAWYGLYLSRLLREAGHKTLVIGLEGTDSFKKAQTWGLEPVALPMNSKNPLELAYLYGKLHRLVAEFKPDIVNCHRGEAFVLWGLLRREGGFALVRTRGDQRPPRSNLVNRILHKRAADAVIATNSRTAGAFTQGLRISPEKVFTILGGVDTSAFYPDKAAGDALRAALGFAPDEFVIGILGRLDPVKGHAVLIKAAAEAARRRPDRKIRLLCIGADSSLKKDELQNLARRTGLGGRVLITGLVDDVRAHINAIDLGVLASTGSEAIARAALEIMACGVPLLSSDVGVMPDILPPEALVPLADVPALAQGLLRCLDEPARLGELAAYGRKAMRGLTPAAFLQNALAVYEFALQRRRSLEPGV